MKRHRSWRIANARPAGEAPAFMMAGRAPPTGLGLALMPFEVEIFALVIMVFIRATKPL